MYDADVIVVGAGAAGLSLARLLTAEPGADGRVPSVVLVEPPPGPARSPERTWCFWEAPGGPYDGLLAASWSLLRVRDRHGAAVTGRSPLPYKMLRSADFVRAVGRELAGRPQVVRTAGTVTTVGGTARAGVVRGTDASGAAFELTGGWVFDTRPPRRTPPARTTLLQHFQGWFVRTAEDRFDPAVAELMDLRTPQPRAGLSFAYVLPLGPREALVEYTEFSPAVLPPGAYEAALREYTARVRPLGRFEVTGTERGVVPMTDAVFPRRAGARVFRLGTAGGAVRPATGYAFAACRRQAAGAARRHRDGRVPVPPRPHARRHLTMDAVLLRALAAGRVDGADFFARLFRDNPLGRVVRFLDGRSTPAEDVALGLRTPVGPMLRSLAELPLLPRTGPGAERPPGPAVAGRARPATAESARPATAEGARP